MAVRPEIVGLGEAMVLFQAADPLDTAATVSVHVAGAELNLLAAAARTGVRTAFCSRVGADPFGRRVLDAAAALGVGIEPVVVDDRHPTGVFFKDVRPDGARRVHYYRAGSAASHLGPADVERALAARPRIVAVSGLTAALGAGPRSAVVTLARRAHSAGIAVALDPNLRPGLAPVLDVLAGLLPYTRYLLLGRDEAGPLFGVDEPDRVFVAARAAGVGEVVLKGGADGCWYGDGTHLPSAATTVVDPVGAGDAFAGGYLAARLRGIAPRGAAWLGTRFAAGVIACAGDTEGLPSAADARALLAEAADQPPEA